MTFKQFISPITRAFSTLKKKAVQFGLGIKLQFLGTTIVTYNDNKQCYIENGYKKNDNIYSIINLILNTAVIAPWAVYKIVDEPAYKQMKSEINKGDNADFRLIRDLRSKSLELYTGDRRLSQLLKYPNPNQTFSDLNRENWLFKLLTGDYFEFWDMPIGGLNAGTPLSMSSLPSPYVDIIPSNTLPLYEIGYRMTLGQYIEFTAEQILHEKYPNPDWTVIGANLYGQSPLTAARDKLLRNNKAVIAQAIAFDNGGERGIVFMDDDRVDPSDNQGWSQVETIKNNFEAAWQPGLSGSKKTFFSSRKVGYIKAGISPVDQGINESEIHDLRSFCNIYGVPSQLLNDPAAKTYNTVTEAEKALIVRCVIPLLCSRRDSVNRKLNRDDNVIVDFDLTVYDQLQPNKTAIADWVNKMPLTNKRKLEIVGEDIPETMTEEEQNAIIIPNNVQMLSDLVTPMSDLTAAANESVSFSESI